MREAAQKLGDRLWRTPEAQCWTLVRAACVASTLVGVVTLLAWFLNGPWLAAASIGGVPIKANSAFCLILCGLALWLLRRAPPTQRQRIAAAGLGGLVATLGLLTLGQYLFGIELWLDQMLVGDPQAAGSPHVAGRMPASSALSFALFGSAVAILALLGHRAVLVWQSLAVTGAFLAVLLLAGYLYDVANLITISVGGVESSIAVPSAATILLLNLALLATRPHSGLVQPLSHPSLGGLMIRRALPIALTLPFLLGWIRLQGEEMGLYGTRFGLALFATANVVLFAIMLWFSAASLNDAETQRIATSGQLSRSEERLRMALNGAHVSTWTWDFTEGLLSWTAGCPALDGFPAEMRVDVAGFEARVHPEDLPLVRAAGYRAMEEHTDFDVEYRVVWPDGSVRWVASKGSGHYDSEGMPLHMEGVFIDITERKRNQEEKRLSEERFRLLFEGVRDYAIYMLDVEGKVLTWNDSAERIMGYSAQEILGQHYSIFHPEAERPKGSRDGVLERTLADGRSEDEGWRARKDGTLFWANIITSPLTGADGKLAGFAKITRDLTERRQVEEALREANDSLEHKVTLRTRELELAKERAESADRLKSQFLASMSHELRTPLNAIIGFTGTLLMGLPGPLTPEQRRQLETVRRSARHQLSLINDLLDLAKVESGEVKLNFEPVDCCALLEEIGATLGPLAEAKKLPLTVHTPSQPVIICTDRRALSQIIINLANNGIKFTQEGEVRLRLTDSGSVRISVEDTGPGLRPEDQAKLFQPFARIERGTGALEGTGLGLHLSRKLATLLGGEVGLESEIGHGSKFSITLPHAQAQTHSQEAG